MKNLRLLTNCWAAVLCLIFVYATSTDGQETSEPTGECLSYVGIGWDELSPEVRSGLLKEILALPRVDHLSESAMAYVEEKDFAPTEIMGPVRLEPDGRELLVALREGRTYALDLPAVGAPLHPGLYWTSGFGIAWTVVLPEGETATYWVNREL